jgi:SAM-dependent methyltransferase
VLDIQTYRAGEQLAKSRIPSWRVSQIHNVDHFEHAGFPVRINSVRELGQIVDTMQENRFEGYMAELGGLSRDEYDLILETCKDAVRFQLTFLPHRPPVLPISTLLSAFALYKKMLGAGAGNRSILEIGPGCGYLSFFLRRHAALANYSQIEACESFYIFQNLVNVFCFGPRFDERALPHEDTPAVDYFTNPRADMEFSPAVRLGGVAPLCSHYPWWRIGEIVSREISFDIVTSNANLLEFNATALDDYLSLVHRSLKPEGVFLVQCTGYPANGTVAQLLEKIRDKGFAPLIFATAQEPVRFAEGGALPNLLDRLADSGRGSVRYTTNNAVFVRAGHPLFQKYYEPRNFTTRFVAPEPLVKSMFFDRSAERRAYTAVEFLEATELAMRSADGWRN